jgi:hypothetical protein
MTQTVAAQTANFCPRTDPASGNPKIALAWLCAVEKKRFPGAPPEVRDQSSMLASAHVAFLPANVGNIGFVSQYIGISL